MLPNWMKRRRTFLLSGMVLAMALAGHPIGFAGGAQVPPKPEGAKSDTVPPAGDPKCSFLRQELLRFQNSAPDIPDRIPASVRSIYGRNVTEVNIKVVQGKISSCDKREKLSSFARLRALESVRLQHIDYIRRELQGASADIVVEAVNGLYEHEARSFYNYETVRAPTIDRDVVKDFPMLLKLVQDSGLPAELKASFTQNFRFIKYEEAGRLQNGLRGIDKNLGTTFAFVLRSDLSDRVAADADQRKAAEEARAAQTKADEEARIQALEAMKRNARITLSLSALLVLGLVGWLLTGRELVTWQLWINVLIVAGLILLGWVLLATGLLTWIMEYMNLAF